MTENAYDLLKKTYEKQQAAINAQEALQSQEKADREALAKKTLEANNRGVYTSYKNAINPYGANASQNNMPTGTSEYLRNAAYGTMLQGLGSNQLNYTTEMQNSNSLWQNWLAEKAGQEADIDAAYADAVIAQQNYDKEQERLSRSSGGGGGSSPPTAIEDTELKDVSAGQTRTQIEIIDGERYYVTRDANGNIVKTYKASSPTKTTTNKSTMTPRYAGTDFYIDKNGKMVWLTK